MKNRSPQTGKQKINNIILAMKQGGATTIKQIIDQTGLIYAEVSPLIKQLIKEGRIVKDETGLGLKLVETDLSEEKTVQKPKPIITPEIKPKTKAEQEILKGILNDINDVDKNILIVAYSMIKQVVERKSQESLYDIASSCGLDITIVMQLNDYILKKKVQKLGEKLNPNNSPDREKDDGR